MRLFISFIAAVFAVVSVCLPGFAGQTAERYQRYAAELVADAERQVDAGRAKEAVALYERALVANPASVPALVGLAQAYEALDDLPSGLKFYRIALVVDPTHRRALLLQGLAFIESGDTDRAAENRDKLARLCKDGCAALDRLSEEITKADKDILAAADGQLLPSSE